MVGGICKLAVENARCIGPRSRHKPAGCKSASGRLPRVFGMPLPFVTKPRIGTQRMERQILCPLGQYDFMDVNGAAVPDQDFLRLCFLLRRPNPHPDQQALIF